MSKSGKKLTLSLMFSILTLLLAVGGFAVFFMTYGTGYYNYGEANSILITVFLSFALILELLVIILSFQGKQGVLTNFFSLIVSVALIAGMAILIGDRVEGIGYTIITAYDVGHGGEEACWLSFLASGLFIAGMVTNVIANFLPQKDSEKRVRKVKNR